MRQFSQLFHDLDEATKTNDRIDHLVNYLNEANPQDSIWVGWFLSDVDFRMETHTWVVEAVIEYGKWPPDIIK